MPARRLNAHMLRDVIAAICLTLLASCKNEVVEAPAPEAPTGLAIMDSAPSDAQLSMSWSPSSGAASYYVKRATTSKGPYTPVAVSTFTYFTDTSLANGTTYFYVVAAANANGESPDSSQISATPHSPIVPPPAPDTLAATSGDSQIGLAWTTSDGATGYKVKRSTTDGGPYSQVGSSASTSYIDPSLTNGTRYYYVVSATNTAGDSGDSVEAGAMPQAPVVAPSVPGNPVATAGNAQVALTWSPSNGAASYNVKRSTTSGGPFVQVATPATTSFTDPSLTNGATYYYVVSATNSAGESADSAQVSATPQAPVVVPSAPSNLITAAGNAQVGLSWSASSSATSYNVKRSTNSGGPYATVAMRTTTSYIDTSLTNGTTYYYVISAVNAAGESQNSAQVGATPQMPVVTPPIPSNLVATAGDAQAGLTWSVSSGATSYNLKRSTTSGGPYTTVATRTTTSFTDPSLVNGTTYYYVVSAANSAGQSADSTQVTATPQTPVVVPSGPTNLAAVAGNAQVSLSWSISSGASTYNVKRSTTNGGPYTTVASRSTTSYVDTSLTNGTSYYYVVTAVNAAGESTSSTQVGSTPQVPVTIPAIPSNVIAVAGNGQVNLGWAASSGATSYNVKRFTTSGGPYTTIGSAVVTSYGDISLANGTRYYYVISAVNSAGESANSMETNATPQVPVVIPSAPGNLAAVAGNAQATLTWSASSGAISYNVKRSTNNGGPYTTVASRTTTLYVDTSLANGTTYYYVVSAVNAAGEGANSTQVGATPQPPVVIPSAPSNLVATAGDAQIGLTWSASSGATSYSVKRATTSGGPYTTILSSAATSYTDTSLTNSTTYYYVVSALNAAGESANSTQVSATPQAQITVPSAPGNLVATAGDAQVGLTWSSSNGATSYNVKRSTASGGPYTTVASPASTSYTDTSLADGTTYYYVVSAVNSSGESTNSTQAAATPQTANTGWHLTWSDEFDGTTLDSSKWLNPTNDNSCNGYTQQTVAADDSYLDGNGHLVIRAQSRSSGGCGSMHLTAGQISTRDRFSQAYGKFEFRAQMPAGGGGIWPALWLYPIGVSWPPEIDVLEDISDMSTVYMTYHWSSSNQQSGSSYTNAGLATGFHTYAVEWEPNLITWYIDGNAVRTFSGSDVSSTPMGILIDIYLGGWAGSVSASFPQYMLVDYVRVYSR